MGHLQKISIAVIDDDEDDYFIIKDYISEIGGADYSISWCRDYASALEKIKENAHDLYFVDYRLGNQTGLDLLKEVSGWEGHAPIVLLTGKGSKSIDIEAMEHGATDYLVKSDLNTEKLERCIRYSLDRAQSLRELRARENKYRNLFENSRDAVFIADRHLSIKEMNEAASQLFSITPGAANGRSLYDFIIEEGQKIRIREMLAEKSAISELEIQLEGNGIDARACLLSLAPQEGSNGSALLHGIVHDITNIKKAEQANVQAQKLAANERLVRILAHEIRNPLNNISLSIENLSFPAGADEKQKSLIDILQRNCIRINQIITELLNLTKPLELNFTREALRDILDESLSIAADRIKLQNVKVEKEYPKAVFRLLTDRAKLVIAFTNIIINAIESLPPENGKIFLSVSHQNDSIDVSIRDNGCGIPSEYLPKLFEPFFTMKKNGMGLGLAASYSIIQSHGGSIRVESVVDKGSNFIISLPLSGEEIQFN